MSDKDSKGDTDKPVENPSSPTEKLEMKIVETEFYDQVPILTRYATNMMVQATPHECILSFYEAEPPVVLGKNAAEQWASINKIKAHCVARVVISLARMPEFVNVIRKLVEPVIELSSQQEEKK